MAPTDALRNHGKCANDMNSSLSPSNSQMPCLEIWVTSASEVLVPSGVDAVLMSFHQLLGLMKLLGKQVGLTPRFGRGPVAAKMQAEAEPSAGTDGWTTPPYDIKTSRMTSGRLAAMASKD